MDKLQNLQVILVVSLLSIAFYVSTFKFYSPQLRKKKGGGAYCFWLVHIILSFVNPFAKVTVDNHVTCGQCANRMLQRILMENQYIFAC